MAIPFTQYLMPFGDFVGTTIDRPADVEADARAVIAAGFRFESEMLRTGEVSMEVLKDGGIDDGGDPVVIAHEVCANGPVVLEAVDRLVRTAKANLPAVA